MNELSNLPVRGNQVLVAADDDLDARAFVRQRLFPADDHTRHVVDRLRRELRLNNYANTNAAICGYLHACKVLKIRESDLFGYPLAKGTYETGKKAYLTLRDRLLDLGHIDRAKDHWVKLSRGRAVGQGVSAVYRVIKWPDLDGLKFRETAPKHPVRVKTTKEARDNQHDGLTLSHKECSEQFGVVYDYYEKQMVSLNAFMADHPLVIQGTEYSYVERIFNNGSIEHGGRLYGSYSNLPKAARQAGSIDGEPVAEVDLKAAGLSILIAKKGKWFPEGADDPYALIPFVVDQSTRDFAKLLVSSTLSTGKPKIKFTDKMKMDFPDLCRGHTTTDHYMRQILRTYPVLNGGYDGLKLMFEESRWMIQVLEELNYIGIPAYPVHDCCVVRVKDIETTEKVMKDQFHQLFGKAPLISVKRNNK